MNASGYLVFPPTAESCAWASVSAGEAERLIGQPDLPRRHGGTWFVGVDALPNKSDGSLSGVPLCGPWAPHINGWSNWHQAQLSIIFPGYPKRDPSETEAAHRYRVIRHGAHVDGLLPEGPKRRRFLREPHAFVLGIALDDSLASPLMVWPGSHQQMSQALAHAIGDQPPGSVDLTDVC